MLPRGTQNSATRDPYLLASDTPPNRSAVHTIVQLSAWGEMIVPPKLSSVLEEINVGNALGNAPEEATRVLQNFEGIAKTPMIPATISTIRKKKAGPFLIGSDFSHGCREESPSGRVEKHSRSGLRKSRGNLICRRGPALLNVYCRPSCYRSMPGSKIVKPLTHVLKLTEYPRRDL